MLIKLFCTIAIVVFLPIITRAEVGAPYQIEDQKGASVVVILDGTTPVAPKSMTMLSSNASTLASLVKKEKRCKTLCPGDNEIGPECHRVGVYALPKSFTSPVIAALAGAATIQVTPLKSSSPKELKVEDWISDTYQPDLVSPILEPEFDGSIKWRWILNPESKSVQLERSSFAADGRHISQFDDWPGGINLKECQLSELSPFELLKCGDMSRLLYINKKVLVVSFADYGDARAEPIAKVIIDKKNYYLIQIGLKGQIVYALLRVEGDKLELLMRARDYALMC